MAFDQAGFQVECGKLVRIWRRRRDLSQQELAWQLRMNRATVANVEKGRQRVAADVLWRISLVLKVPVKRLMPEPL